MKKIIPILILLAVAAGTFYWYTQKTEVNYDQLSGSGTIEGTQVEITPKIMGRIGQINAAEGDFVKQEQVLVELEHEELDKQLLLAKAGITAAQAQKKMAGDQLRLAKTNLKNAETEYRRAKRLHKSGSVSQRVLDQAVTGRDSLRAQTAAATSQVEAAGALVEQAKAQVDYVLANIDNATLDSPIDGLVLSKNLEVGENAFPGGSVLSLVDQKNLWVKLYISGKVIGRAKIGMAANITIDSFPEKIFPGKVVFVSPVAEFTPKNVQTQEERVRLVYAVKVEVDGSSGELKVGMPADVALVED